MKNLFGALAFAAAFAFTQHASALVITAKLDSFDSIPQTIAGVGSGGGRGNFSLTGADAPITGSLASILDDSFSAVCLEPDSFVTVGETYRFEVTGLQFAPTRTGGMGPTRESLVETALGRQGVTTVDAMDNLGIAKATALVYEAGYESAVNGLDLTSGTAVVTGTGAPGAQASLAGDILTDVTAFALINRGPVFTGFGVRTVFEGQDFMVTVGEQVPSPAPLALLGLGLLGLGYVRSKKAA